MASCGEVDHSVSSLPSSKKGGGGGGNNNNNSGGGSGNSAESSCSGSSNPSPALSVPECAICLQSCVHPVQLPCHHVFCFLCVKGASWQSKRCALCRQEVPDDFLERPTLLSPEELKASAGGRGGAASDHAWYYEGRNGWWQYDERTSRELEDAFSKGKKTAEMLIAGFLYVADLENMVQYRRNEHGRRRKIKRDVLDIPKKGVAGLRLDTEGVIGAAGWESSADGADMTVAGAQVQVTGIPPTITAPTRPPTSLGAQPGSSSGSSSGSGSGPTVEDALSQLQITPRPTPAPERSDAGEGEEEDEEEEASPSRSSDPHTSVDESGSGDWSEEDEDEEEEEGGDGERVEPWEDRPRRQRLTPEDRTPPGAESTSPSSSSSSGRSRMPDGQCTVTEV